MAPGRGRRRSEHVVKRLGPQNNDVPFQTPMSGSLTPGARKILAAASEVLMREGYAALTYERVAELAGVNKSTIRYTFGSRAALVTAVVDALVHDDAAGVTALTTEASLGDGVKGLTQAFESIIEHSHAFPEFFEILPEGTRNPELRSRLLAHYDWWDQENLRWLGFQQPDGAADPDRERLQLALARVNNAIVDGLSIRRRLDPEFDLGPPMEAVALMLKYTVPLLGANAGKAGP
jgi:AcrR family transcriptional regulator